MDRSPRSLLVDADDRERLFHTSLRGRWRVAGDAGHDRRTTHVRVLSRL